MHTHFREITYRASKEQGLPLPTLHVRIEDRLPERELRVLYRISQLTGVLLEEDVITEGVDISNLTVLASCDQIEVQYARRCLHRYIDHNAILNLTMS